jgi:thymidylate synthase
MKNIPVLHVMGGSIAEAYEKALLLLYENGIRMRTQYDRENDPPSIDATMNITIEQPWSDPMIHKAFPGGIEDLREYVLELSGAKDHWMKNMNDPDDTRWEYTYHWRLKNYGTWKEQSGKRKKQAVCGPFRVDQIERLIEKLAGEPYTRRAQMITWMPWMDLDCYDPPCLQSLHCRVVEDEEGVWWLNCNIRFRSNDAWGANFMNMFGFVQFTKHEIAVPLGKRVKRRVELGRLNWHADSYHIYGKDIEEFEKRLLAHLKKPFASRVYNFFDPMIQEIYREAEPGLWKKIREHDEKHME